MTFVNFKTCCSDAKQFIRLVVLVICICISCYQLAGCFRKISYPPISTHYGFHLNDTLRYPAVTICREPGYKTELFKKYGFRHNQITYSTSWQWFKYDEFTLQQFFEETTFDFEEMVGMAALDKMPKNINVTSSFYLNFGRCFTITPVNESKYWGSKYGYFFYFSHTDTNKSESSELFTGSLPGFHVFIQNEVETFTEKSQQADMFREYIYLEAGDSLQVNLRVNKYNQLPSSNNNCNPNSNYSKSRCVEDHVNKHISEDVGCSTPWIPNNKLAPCNSYDEVQKMIDYSTPSSYLVNYLQQADCTGSCNATSYMPFVQSIREMALPGCNLRIYFSSNLYTLMEEVIGYDWNNFLSDLGGSLGFLLGLSVLGTIALVEQLIATVIKITESKKANVQLNNSNSNEDTTNETNVQTTHENEISVNCKNKINEYKMDFEFYTKKNELKEYATEKY